MLTAPQEGHIYWLKDTSESQSAKFDSGKLNHPVLVLGAERAGSVQALVITSLGSTTLSAKFPERDDRRRKKYLPLGVAGAVPHPDNGILLSVRAGRPPILTKPSYVNLEPFEVEVRFLNLDKRSTDSLGSGMLERLMGKLLELYPRFVPHPERSSSQSSSQPPARQPRVSLATRPQPLTQQSAPPPPPPPQRAYSNTSSTTASRQDHRENTEWNATRLPNPVTRPQPPTQQSSQPQRAYSTHYGTTPRQDYRQDLERGTVRPSYSRPHYHDSEGESDSISGWNVLGYLGIAAGIFVAARYLLR
ncbi:hypothetical protein B9Z19DRAFT_1105071 [Tuber borchii]|uniref:Uncharacterized protein n=1 Tax=Tuber borchii TaxID=42251 RepID=A0A2T7A756_TUBBO|nr:hypothetical protein B9Z19DRAFT_1105071 [Tuber borchii]